MIFFNFLQVYKRMKSHDLGCGSGAGADNKDVLNVSVVNARTQYGPLRDTIAFRCFRSLFSVAVLR